MRHAGVRIGRLVWATALTNWIPGFPRNDGRGVSWWTEGVSGDGLSSRQSRLDHAAQGTAAEEVEVQVVDLLARGVALVDHQPMAAA